MRVISIKRLREFWEAYSPAEGPLKIWYAIAAKANWANITETRLTFPSADAVTLECGKTVTVFNIGGNKYRLVADILYEKQVIYVKKALTHSEYDKNKWKAQICNE